MFKSQYCRDKEPHLVEIVPDLFTEYECRNAIWRNSLHSVGIVLVVLFLAVFTLFSTYLDFPEDAVKLQRNVVVVLSLQC